MIPLAAVQASELFAEFIELETPSGWYLLVADPPSEVVDEVAGTFEAFEIPVVLVDVSDTGARALTAPVDGGTATVAIGVEQWTGTQAMELDLLRERVRTSRPLLVFVTTQVGAEALARHAPNFMSFLAEGTVRLATPTMSDEARMSRLAELRATWKTSDAEVIDAAKRGALPAEPDFYTWLVMLGRGDLVPPRRAREA